MAMLPRFFAPALDPDRPEVALPAEESHHLTRVLRLGRGDRIAVFDGRGHEYRARVVDAGRHAATVTLEAPLPARPEPAARIVLAQAVLKADSMDAVVRDATVLGAAAIVPILTAHLAASRRGLQNDKVVDRWRRVALAAAKQCRRATLPGIEAPLPFDAWLARDVAGLRLLLTEPSAEVPSRALRDFANAPRPETLTLVAGPEGGWEPSEIARAAAAGVEPVSLGALTLRAELAPVVALSMAHTAFDL